MDFHVLKPKDVICVVENPLFSRKNKRVCKINTEMLQNYVKLTDFVQLSGFNSAVAHENP